MLDNADNKADFFPEEDSPTDGSSASSALAQFIPQGGQGTVIITTRDLELADQLADSNILPKYMMEAAQAEQRSHGIIITASATCSRTGCGISATKYGVFSS